LAEKEKLYLQMHLLAELFILGGSGVIEIDFVGIEVFSLSVYDDTNTEFTSSKPQQWFVEF
jgi:hypothetical protein